MTYKLYEDTEAITTLHAFPTIEALVEFAVESCLDGCLIAASDKTRQVYDREVEIFEADADLLAGEETKHELLTSIDVGRDAREVKPDYTSDDPDIAEGDYGALNDHAGLRAVIYFDEIDASNMSLTVPLEQLLSALKTARQIGVYESLEIDSATYGSLVRPHTSYFRGNQQIDEDELPTSSTAREDAKVSPDSMPSEIFDALSDEELRRVHSFARRINYSEQLDKKLEAYDRNELAHELSNKVEHGDLSQVTAQIIVGIYHMVTAFCEPSRASQVMPPGQTENPIEDQNHDG